MKRLLVTSALALVVCASGCQDDSPQVSRFEPGKAKPVEELIDRFGRGNFFLIHSKTAGEVIMELWRIEPFEMVDDAGLNGQRYDWLIAPVDGESDLRDQCRRVLAEWLEREEGLLVRRSEREMPVLLLEMDGQGPQGFEIGPAVIKQRTRGGISNTRVFSNGLTFERFVAYLAKASGRIVVDRTGLDASQLCRIEVRDFGRWNAGLNERLLEGTNLRLVAGLAVRPVVTVTRAQAGR